MHVESGCCVSQLVEISLQGLTLCTKLWMFYHFLCNHLFSVIVCGVVDSKTSMQANKGPLGVVRCKILLGSFKNCFQKSFLIFQSFLKESTKAMCMFNGISTIFSVNLAINLQQNFSITFCETIHFFHKEKMFLDQHKNRINCTVLF